MSRKQRSDTELRKQNSIKYPRKCDCCDYMSNNPSMFHYHKKTHYSVENKFCDHGCGLPAKFVSTTETYCCSKSHMQCTAVRKEFADMVTDQWLLPGSDERRKDARKTFIKATHNKDTRDKMSRTRRTKTGLLTEEIRTDFRKYSRACRSLSQLWAKDNGYELGPQTFHVDHIYSILDGFKNEIAPSITSHPANLRVIEAKKNAAKGGKSEITLEELLERINND